MYQPPVAPYTPPQPQPPPYPGGYQPATPVYGPPAGQQMMPPAEIKWSGLSTGGAFKIPVIAFIGRLTEIIKDSSGTFGLRIVEKWDQVQILRSPAPWPWATLEFSIPYKDRENSGWGHHVESAKALGLALQAVTLDQAIADLLGKSYEMLQSEQSYGEDRQTGQTMKGDVWRFVRIVQPGQAQAFPQPQYAVPPSPATVALPPAGAFPAPTAVQPVPVAPLPAPVPAPAPAPAPVAPTPVAPTGVFDTTLSPDDTAPVRAKKLLHNKALNEWLGIALLDDKIKADPGFINTIYDQSFIVGLKASNQVAQGADGKFTVIA